MNTYTIGEADRIHVKGEYYKGKKLLRCSNCGTRGISMFDRHCNGCGFLLDRIDSVDGAMRFSHTPPIKEVEELPDFTKTHGSYLCGRKERINDQRLQRKNNPRVHH